MIAIKNVLVATDFSPPSETALSYGRELARTFGGQLRVLHVVENVAVQLAMSSGSFAGMPVTEIQRDIETGAWEQLEKSVRDDDRRELKAVLAVRTAGSIAQGIVAYAAETGVDVVVIGTHGRGGVAHLLMGSVAERVVRTAPCPVLTVRHPEREFLKSDVPQRAERAAS